MNLTKPQYCKVKRHLGSIDDETPGTRGSHTSSLAPKIWITDWMALLSHLQVKSYTGGTRDKRRETNNNNNHTMHLKQHDDSWKSKQAPRSVPSAHDGRKSVDLTPPTRERYFAGRPPEDLQCLL
ncbi:hypothetical protein Pcinc_041694 [Petrolisthes cinctipes]|uniref:Uncharacterized protein n=1 Tax=Petrolisthes cinctipes TaxID=88211 RepID=A0AAE1BM22_PETCI|nr:hypothetical protein Pcinc_041694 [Petrolisthes cinctipes]